MWEILNEIVMPIIMCLYLITAGHLIISPDPLLTLRSAVCLGVWNAKFNKHLWNAEWQQHTNAHEGLVQLSEMETVFSLFYDVESRMDTLSFF
jgi:hypothetical protein